MRSYILLSDIIVGYTGGHNPVCVNFGLPVAVATKLMVQVLDEHLGIKISDEYAEMVIENYRRNDPTYVDGVIKEIRYLHKLSFDVMRAERSRV